MKNGKIVGLSPLTEFAVDVANLNDVIVVEESSLAQSERYPVGYKVRSLPPYYYYNERACQGILKGEVSLYH